MVFFFQKFAKINLVYVFSPWILEKLEKKLLEWIKELSVLCIYTDCRRNGKDLQIHKRFLSLLFEVKFSGQQYACSLRINLCYANSSHFQFVLDSGEVVDSNINEILLHYYFLFQCTLKCHINIIPYPLHTQTYFFVKSFHSEHSYSNHRLLILRGILDI